MRFSLESIVLLTLASGVFSLPAHEKSSSSSSSDASPDSTTRTSSSTGGAQKAIVVTAMQGSVNFKTLKGQEVGGYKLIAIDSPEFGTDQKKQAQAIKAKVHEPKTMIVTSAHGTLRAALKELGVDFVSACPGEESMETEYATNLKQFGHEAQVTNFKKNWKSHFKSCPKPATYEVTLTTGEKVSDPAVVKKIAAKAKGSGGSSESSSGAQSAGSSEN